MELVEEGVAHAKQSVIVACFIGPVMPDVDWHLEFDSVDGVDAENVLAHVKGCGAHFKKVVIIKLEASIKIMY